jgi:hypothetical protein
MPSLFMVNIGRCHAFQRLMEPLIVAEIEESAQSLPQLARRGAFIQVDLLIFDGSPEPLHENVVEAAPSMVHAYSGVSRKEYAGEFGACALAALIRVDDLWRG